MIELNVPFKEKECVKELGASWNSEKKVWYVNSLEELTPFRKWLPTGKALLKIFLKVEEDKHKLEQADKLAAVQFERAKGEAANIFAIANYTGLDYNRADAVCSFIYMHAWPRGENTINGMYIVRDYAFSKGMPAEEAIEELKKLRVPYDYGAERVC
jgi:inorganic triphosphatase YgiF